jgi:T4 RnlA family RNA ligase
MIDMKRLAELVEKGLVTKRDHPAAPISIYNYGMEVQFKRLWCPLTMMCRGLILGHDGTIHARPLVKFFNLTEHTYENQNPITGPLPNEQFEVFAKEDGSLAISFIWEGKVQLATRGSFESEQAQWATYFLHTNLSKQAAMMLEHPELTFLFEIIYPENRIVVDYFGRQDLVLLTAINRHTGAELPYEALSRFGFTVVKRYDCTTAVEGLAEELGTDNMEGFVVRYKSGLRVKIKLADYVRLHRIVTGVSPRRVWEVLAANQSLEDWLRNVPDEFYRWVTSIKDDLQKRYEEIEQTCKQYYKNKPNGTRKDVALYFQQCKYPGILFKMLDLEDYSPQIWKLIKPETTKTFKCSE